ncbi:MAG: hypothetical protein ACYCXK_07115 [Candidatus Humimicrobiaceae bacterium]
MYQGNGKLYRLSRDIEIENDSSENINDLIIDNEKAEEIYVSSILEMTEKYKDFKKITRYKVNKNNSNKI